MSKVYFRKISFINIDSFFLSFIHGFVIMISCSITAPQIYSRICRQTYQFVQSEVKQDLAPSYFL